MKKRGQAVPDLPANAAGSPNPAARRGLDFRAVLATL